MSGGGGGTSGAVEFPQYTMETHARFLASTGVDSSGNYDSTISSPSKDILQLFDDALGQSPYGVYSVTEADSHYDNTRLANFDDKVSSYSTGSVDDIVSSALRATDRASVSDFENIGVDLATTDLYKNASTDAKQALDDAIEKASTIASTQEIDDIVSEFSDRRDLQEQEQIAQFNARMADGGAVNSSAYGIGLALLQSEHVRAEAEYDAQVSLEAFNNALEGYIQTFINQVQNHIEREALQVEAETNVRQIQEERYIRSLQATLSLLTNEVEFSRALAEVNLDQDSTVYRSKLNEAELNSTLDREDELWDFTVAEEAMNVLAAPSGMARRLPRQKPTWEKVAGKAIQGAAAVGSIVAAGSDRRIKEDIRRIATHPFGFGIYLFDYKWGPSNVIGYIAQEVGAVLPQAVGKKNGDFFIRYRFF